MGIINILLRLRTVTDNFLQWNHSKLLTDTRTDTDHSHLNVPLLIMAGRAFSVCPLDVGLEGYQRPSQLIKVTRSLFLGPLFAISTYMSTKGILHVQVIVSNVFQFKLVKHCQWTIGDVTLPSQNNDHRIYLVIGLKMSEIDRLQPQLTILKSFIDPKTFDKLAQTYLRGVS